MLILENCVVQIRLIITELDVLIVGKERKKTINDALDGKHQGC
jgi:hypothetical protein